MDFFNRKKVARLQTIVKELEVDKEMMKYKIQQLDKMVCALWDINDYHEKVIKSIPSVKRCMECANFKADKKGFPICDCGNTIFEITNNCPYTPK